MTVLEDFENTLKEVVNAKRLSASKMNKLTEIAMKSLEDDTRLVATLYRTHKSLPSFAKVSSLYAFDALARAARSLVNKRGITGDINSPKGNAATLLLKIEGVLEGLFQDMVSLNNSEAKEKTSKVLDIWAKSNTFPSAVLTQLRDILSDVRKENTVNPTPSVDSCATTNTPTTTTTPQPTPAQTASVPDVQATLLALLGQAAQATSQGQQSSQTPPHSDPQQLQQTQMALLQQLALTAKLADGSPTPPSGQTPPPTDRKVPPAVAPALGSLHTQSQTRSSRFDNPGDTPYGRNGNLDRTRDRHDFRDERRGRGGFRGGYRGRGRWDDSYSHDRFRHRDRDRDPPSRPRHSRSRSPRRHEERRGARPYSPSRRPLNDRHGHQPELPTPTSARDTDEFGRDIRASSASPSQSALDEDTKALAPMDSSVDPTPLTPGAPSDYHTPVSDQSPLVAASTSAQSTETHTPSSASQQQPGLDRFDIATFDATSPSSWETLGNMWQITYGYPPSQEELMHFVMTGSMAAAGMGNGGFNGAQGSQWQQQGHAEEHGDRGLPRHGGLRGGRGRGHLVGGRGVHGYSENGNGYANTAEPSEPSYAVVLNGGGESSDGSVETNNQSMEQDYPDEKLQDLVGNAGPSGGGGGGRMRRVGDKWMFVKEG